MIKRPKIAFMGSPFFAASILKELHTFTEIALVITQPDKPSSRGQKVVSSPVKTCALECGLFTLCPDKLHTPQMLAEIKALDLDAILVAAYGKILKPELLAIPRLGCINVHASLLPKFRGASPISAAILTGEEVTGVSLMQMTKGLDEGPVYVMESLRIHEDTTGLLTERLATLGATLLKKHLLDILNGKLSATPQPADGMSYCTKLSKKDARFDLSKSALELERQVRAHQPWPGSFVLLPDAKKLYIHQAKAIKEMPAQPKTLCVYQNKLLLVLENGSLDLQVVQSPSKNKMPASAWLQGQQKLKFPLSLE